MYSVSDKLAIIRLVDNSELSIRRTLVAVSTAGSELMSTMVPMGHRTVAEHYASTGIEYLIRYVNWSMIWP
jgi:hypothetical protein